MSQPGVCYFRLVLGQRSQSLGGAYTAPPFYLLCSEITLPLPGLTPASSKHNHYHYPSNNDNPDHYNGNNTATA